MLKCWTMRLWISNWWFQIASSNYFASWHDLNFSVHENFKSSGEVACQFHFISWITHIFWPILSLWRISAIFSFHTTDSQLMTSQWVPLELMPLRSRLGSASQEHMIQERGPSVASLWAQFPNEQAITQECCMRISAFLKFTSPLERAKIK